MRTHTGKMNWSKKGGLSIAMLKNAALDFDSARKEQIYYGKEGDLKLSKRQVMVVNDRTNTDVVAVSDDYNIIQHKDAVDAVSDALLNLNIEGLCAAAEMGNKIFVDIIFPKVEFDMKAGESFIGGMRIINSYDKTTGIMVLPQLMRVKCSNGMILSTVWIDSINVRHTSKLALEFEKQVPKLIKSMADGCDKFRLMLENCIGDSVEWLYLEKLLPVIVKQEKYRIAIVEHLKRDHTDGSAYTRWELYNAITYLCSHEQQLRPSVENQLQKVAEKLLVTPLASIPLPTLER
jgi:hypothetical protein